MVAIHPLPNPQCVQSINVAVAVLSGYITEEEMYREHSVMAYSSVEPELLT